MARGSEEKESRSSNIAVTNPKIGLTLQLYRWITWILVWIIIFTGSAPPLTNFQIWFWLGLIFVYTLLLTIFWMPVTRLLLKRPWIITFDVAICTLVIGFTYGWRSPYYLYSLSPILVAAFFFQFKGGFSIATLYSATYTLALILSGWPPARIYQIRQFDSLIGHYFTYYLVAGFFAFPSHLLGRLKSANKALEDYKEELAQANQQLGWRNTQLQAIAEINKAMQSTLDLNSVMTVILEGLTKGMGFNKALVGLIDEKGEEISDWFGSANVPPVNYENLRLSLKASPGVVTSCVLKKQACDVMGAAKEDRVTRILRSNQSQKMAHSVLPMVVRDRVIGVMIIGRTGFEEVAGEGHLEVLQTFADQAAIAIANAKLYQQSRELALMKERNRIALEMHDSVVQTLSGGLMLVDATCKGVRKQKSLQGKLSQVRELMTESLQNMRSCIFNLRTGELSAPGFASFLKFHLSQFAKENNFSVDFLLRGEERVLDQEFKQVLCKIVHEALTNIAKHADAQKVAVSLHFDGPILNLSIRDDGRGFAVDEAFAQAAEKRSLGLIGMKERTEQCGGEFMINSFLDQGTEVSLRIPLA